MLLAHSPPARSRMAALCSSLCATAQAFSCVRISGASTCWWLIDFRWSVSDMSKSSPWSQCHSRSPHTDPHSSPGLLAVERQQVLHGADAVLVEPLLGLARRCPAGRAG